MPELKGGRTGAVKSTPSLSYHPSIPHWRMMMVRIASNCLIVIPHYSTALTMRNHPTLKGNPVVSATFITGHMIDLHSASSRVHAGRVHFSFAYIFECSACHASCLSFFTFAPHWQDFERAFEWERWIHKSIPCFCMFWSIAGKKTSTWVETK